MLQINDPESRKYFGVITAAALFAHAVPTLNQYVKKSHPTEYYRDVNIPETTLSTIYFLETITIPLSDIYKMNSEEEEIMQRALLASAKVIE